MLEAREPGPSLKVPYWQLPEISMENPLKSLSNWAAIMKETLVREETERTCINSKYTN